MAKVQSDYKIVFLLHLPKLPQNLVDGIHTIITYIALRRCIMFKHN